MKNSQIYPENFDQLENIGSVRKEKELERTIDPMESPQKGTYKPTSSRKHQEGALVSSNSEKGLFSQITDDGANSFENEKV